MTADDENQLKEEKLILDDDLTEEEQMEILKQVKKALKANPNRKALESIFKPECILELELKKLL